MNFRYGLIFLFLICLMEKGHAQTGIEEILRSAYNKEAFWSVSVLDPDGVTLEAHNATKLVQPGSNLKLFSSAAILSTLGADYRFKTSIFGRGELVDSVWVGDLVVRGSGDPGISGNFYDNDRLFVFRSLTDQLTDKGIQKITGVIFADTYLFDDEIYPKGWDWDDLSFYYGVEVTPLAFNNNTVDLTVRADGNKGDVPSIEWFPFNTEYVDFINKQRIIGATGTYDEYYRRIPGSKSILLKSALPEGYLEEESLSVPKGALYFVDTFRKYLHIRGLNVESGAVAVTDALPFPTEDMEVLAVHESKPLSEYIAHMNKESDNFYAEMLLKSMAAHSGLIPASYDKAIPLVKSFLAGFDVDTNYVEMRDASGLSSGTFITTLEMSTFLHQFKRDPNFSYFYESLAVAGTDGTLDYRMRQPPLRGNIRGKSGYIRGVRALSGYITTKSGAELSFSIATNNFAGKVRNVDQTHEKILEYLYQTY